jgi:hypothetical protein
MKYYLCVFPSLLYENFGITKTRSYCLQARSLQKPGLKLSIMEPAKHKILGRHQLFKSEISALRMHFSITYCLRYVAPRFQYVGKFTSWVEYSFRGKSEFIDALIKRAYSPGAFPRDGRERSCRPTHFQVLPNCSSPLREEPVPTAVGRSLLSAI